MLLHSVYFWLKPDLRDEERCAFVGGLETLRGIDLAQDVVIAAPVPSERAVVDSSYDFALVIKFADKAAHDSYQVHPVHLAFVEQFAPCWTQVKVYDCE